jgi:hypothetical protein
MLASDPALGLYPGYKGDLLRLATELGEILLAAFAEKDIPAPKVLRCVCLYLQQQLQDYAYDDVAGRSISTPRSHLPPTRSIWLPGLPFCSSSASSLDSRTIPASRYTLRLSPLLTEGQAASYG